MKTDVYNFNKKYVGKDSVFLDKNGAPRILEQFKDNPYSLELRDEFTTGNKPKKLPTAGATYYHGKPATRKVLCAYDPSSRKVRRSTLLLTLGHSTEAGARRTEKRTAFGLPYNDGRSD